MTRIIGFDLGEKTLGIAISDPLRIIVTRLKTIYFNKNDYETASYKALEIINKENVNDVVIGLPLNMNGSESKMSKKVLIFKKKLLLLKPSLNIEIIDERLSTMAAKRNFAEINLSSKKYKTIIDTEAAAIILETYLKKIKK